MHHGIDQIKFDSRDDSHTQHSANYHNNSEKAQEVFGSREFLKIEKKKDFQIVPFYVCVNASIAIEAYKNSYANFHNFVLYSGPIFVKC